MFPGPDALRDALSARPVCEFPALPGRTNHIRAGVLVPLSWRPTPSVLLTLRPRTIRHGGEVSFPGGRAEPGDRGLRDTALREAHEELGLVAPDVLGRLASMPVYTSDHRLEPFVAAIDDTAELRPSPDEVERVLRVDLDALMSSAHFDALTWAHDGETHLSPVFVVDDVDGPLAVYGATAHTLFELLEILAELMGRPLPPLEPGRFAWGDLVRYRADAPRHTAPL